MDETEGEMADYLKNKDPKNIKWRCNICGFLHDAKPKSGECTECGCDEVVPLDVTI